MEVSSVPFIHRPHPRANRVKISLDRDGNVIVTTPVNFPKAQIPSYLEKASDWIRVHQEQIVHSPVLLDHNSCLFFGMPFDLVILPHKDATVIKKLDTLEISPIDTSPAGIIAFMEKWLKNRAAEYILPRVSELAILMQTSYGQVHFREQRTRWGSCSSDKNLNFNWRLIHAPKAVIDYVVIHELAHTVHLNHGPRFWEMVTKYDPDHPLHRGWLKRMGGGED